MPAKGTFPSITSWSTLADALPRRDGNIRYFEYENDKFEFLSEYKSADPQRGLAFLPKRALNIHENEVMRGFKTVNDSYIEPVAFIVPRRAEVFQGDIYPPVPGSKPGATAAQWLGGTDALPPKIDLESVYEGQEPVEVPSDYKPPAPLTPMPPPEPKKPEPAKAESIPPTPATARAPPPSMKEQGASVASLASKFADAEDKEEDEEEEDSSSFEEVPQPAARQAPAATQSPVKAKSSLQEYEHVAAPTAQPAASMRGEKVPAPESSKVRHPLPLSAHEPSFVDFLYQVPTSDDGAALTSKSSSQDLQRLQAEVSQSNALIKQMSQAMQQQNELISKLAAEVKNMKHERE